MKETYTHELGEVLVDSLHVSRLEGLTELLVDHKSLEEPLRRSCYLLVASHSFVHRHLTFLHHT